MSDNHPSRRDILMSLRGVTIPCEHVEAQAGPSSMCFMSAVEMARTDPREEALGTRGAGGALDAD